jgi:hypothetical protein
MPILEITCFAVTCHHVLVKCERWLSGRGDRLVVKLEKPVNCVLMLLGWYCLTELCLMLVEFDS